MIGCLARLWIDNMSFPQAEHAPLGPDLPLRDFFPGVLGMVELMIIIFEFGSWENNLEWFHDI